MTMTFRPERPRKLLPRLLAAALFLGAGIIPRAASAAQPVRAGDETRSSSAAAPNGTVRVGVFGLFRPIELLVRPVRGSVLLIRAGAETWALDDEEQAHLRVVDRLVECSTSRRTVRAPVVRVTQRSHDPLSGDLVLAVPGKIARRFRGTLEVTASAEGEAGLDGGDAPRTTLLPVVTMKLEVAVASTVAAESAGDSGIEALKAQAVATRAYYVAARGRHKGFDFCDTTHCQFLRSPPAPAAPASVATRATSGLILTYRGAPLAALYSASCGGRTRTLAAVGMLVSDPRGYPYFAVDCPYCREHARAWSVRIDDPGPDTGALLREGVSSESARLRVARQVGWSVLPGNGYELSSEGNAVLVHGRGAGHGVGLCQEGAQGMAEAGADFRAILRHYYP